MRLPRFGRPGRTVLFSVFGLFIFFIVFYVSLPFGRFRDWLVARVATVGYELEAKSVGPAFGIGMVMRDVTFVGIDEFVDRLLTVSERMIRALKRFGSRRPGN